MTYGIRLLILLSLSLRCESWGWFSSSKETPSRDNSYYNEGNFRGSSAEFSIKAFNNEKGMKLVDNAKKKMIGSNTCWQSASQHLFAGCSKIWLLRIRDAFVFGVALYELISTKNVVLKIGESVAESKGLVALWIFFWSNALLLR